METETLLLLQKSPFGQVLRRTATNRMVESDFTTVKNRTIETDITRYMVENKISNGVVMSQVSKVLDQKLAPLSRTFSELIPEESLTNVYPFVKICLQEKFETCKWQED